VVYQKAAAQIFMNPKSVPTLLSGIRSDDLAIINAKLGLGRLDFEGYIESSRKFTSNTMDQARGELDQ